MTVTMNGKALDTFPVNDPGDAANTLNSYDLTSSQIAQLKTGKNSFAFRTKGVVSYTGVSQLELETVYNRHRTIASPPQDFTPRLTATTNTMRIDHIAGTAKVMTGSHISTAPARIRPSATTFRRLTRRPMPGSRSLRRLQAQSFLCRAAASSYLSTSRSISRSSSSQATPEGIPAIIKFTGGSMPMYIGIDAVKNQIKSRIPIAGPFVYNESVFNVCSLVVKIC